MTSKAIKKKSQPLPTATLAGSASQPRSWLSAIAAVALCWLIAATAVSSRIHLVMGYRVLSGGPPQLEPFLATYSSWGFALLAMSLWCGMAAAILRCKRMPVRLSATLGWVIGSLAMACLPLLSANVLRAYGTELPASYWEPLWLAGWTGLSFAWLVQTCVATSLSLIKSPRARDSGDSGDSMLSYRLSSIVWRRWDLLAIVVAVCLATVEWAWQSHSYYSNFLLGFNDFGHFAQRIANTASGRGLLLESPVLPMFWDHFNPGLLLLVPLWMLFPSPHLFFVLQAMALASGGIFVWGIARQVGLGRLPALLFGMAWVAQPVLGQMNLAYTYGWHPISLAIPLLLAAMWSLIAHRPWLALALAVLAMSMEESVIVIVCLFCVVAAVTTRWPMGAEARGASNTLAACGVSASVWLLLAVICGATFVLVYRLSGLAEFQTARFATLGSSTGEVVLSPFLRPAAFWGSLFRWPKLYFLLCLWLPCFVPSLLRGWRPLLVTALPLLVLLVWDHLPATSLAFQYASTLLPLFWLATLQGTRAYAAQSETVPTDAAPTDGEQLAAETATAASRQSRASGAAAGALATGLILSLYAGQLPYSSRTLMDVIMVSYGATDSPHQRRLATQDDGRWLTEQVRRIRQDGSAVLATGRIAAHVVGNSDVETVGQYLLRRPQLAMLADRLQQPITHYRWIILDRREGFLQTPAEIDNVEAEALQAGFRIIADQFGVVVMEGSHDF